MSVQDLWAAVVMQARDDIAAFPIRSVEYAQAVEFFTAGGEWGKSRQAIADFLELHPDDIRRFGEAAIKRRALEEPAIVEAVAAMKPPDPSPAPKLESEVVRFAAPPVRPRTERLVKTPWWLRSKILAQ